MTDAAAALGGAAALLLVVLAWAWAAWRARRRG